MKMIKQFFNMLSNLVLIVIAAGLLIASPLVIGYKPVMVLSGSMEPDFQVGSVIYYKKASFDEIHVGDPITFYINEDGTMVTHRVVEKNESLKEFITEGDANGSPDPNPVTYDRVAGKATDFCIPKAGYFIAFCRQLPVIMTLGGILVLNMILDAVFPDKKKDRTKVCE